MFQDVDPLTPTFLFAWAVPGVTVCDHTSASFALIYPYGMASSTYGRFKILMKLGMQTCVGPLLLVLGALGN